jgi:hypothetical protein
VLEFLVAFSLLTVVLASFLAALGVALRNDRQAAFMIRASLLAKAKIAAAGIDYPLRVGTTGAIAESGYRWQAVVRSFIPPRGEGGVSVSAFWVEVTVSEPRAGGRSLTLASLEIVPATRP